MGRFGAGEAFVVEAGVAEIDQEAYGDADYAHHSLFRHSIRA